jgi:hypothetical protein
MLQLVCVGRHADVVSLRNQEDLGAGGALLHTGIVHGFGAIGCLGLGGILRLHWRLGIETCEWSEDNTKNFIQLPLWLHKAEGNKTSKSLPCNTMQHGHVQVTRPILQL